MATQLAFTMPRIAQLECEAGKQRTYFRDEKCSHLWLAVTDKGAKTFFVYARTHGSPKRHKIGRFPEVGIDKARSEAKRLFGEIVSGKDPQAAKRELRHGLTLRQLFDDYLEAYAKPRKRTWHDDESQFNRHLSAWEGRKAAEIQQHHIATLHSKIGRENGTYTANRLLSLLHAVYAWAKSDRGFKGDNPAHGIRKFPEEKRERHLSQEELPRFFAALEDEPNEDFRDFFMLCLLTGARRGNVQSMKWADINLRENAWVIPSAAFKTKKTQTVVLVSEAVDILSRRKSDSETPFVFPSRGKSGHLEEPKLAWARLLERADLKDLRIHDLRRTLGSWMAMGGASLPIVGKALGHTRTETTATYARLQLVPVREAVKAAAKSILDAGKRKEGAK